MPQRMLNEAQTRAFLNSFGNPFTLTSQNLTKLFSHYRKTGTAYYTDDLLYIGPNDSPFVKEHSLTTVGTYIVNRFIVEDLKVFGYINKTFNKKIIGKLEDGIATALLEDDITIEQVYQYIDRTQFLFGGTVAHIINPSLSSAILNLPPSAKKLREKLIEENKEAIDAGDPIISHDVEVKVCDDALKTIRALNDPAMDIFDSGSGVDFYNNYKTMFVMKGAVMDNTGEYASGYKTITSNYDSGISKEDMPKIADSLPTSAYSKGVSTQDSGYSGKKYNNMYQRTRVGPRGSDCGTTFTREVEITSGNAGEYSKYYFIMEKGKPKMLTPKNIKDYIGKRVQLRTPEGCKYKEPCYCNVCIGDLPYRIDTQNIGLQFNILTGALLNANMKKFHDITIKTYAVDINNDLLRYDAW